MKVAIYCRVSTEDQASAGTIANQVEFSGRYCDLHNLTIYDYYLDEGISGSIPLRSRPAGARLLEDATSSCFEAVYVYRLDRLARTTLDILRTHEMLSSSGVSLRSMTESFDTATPSGKFFMTTLGGIAEIERETIAERMRLGKERALREGRWSGGPPPFGYSLKQKRLVVNEREAAVVRRIFKLYTEGCWSTKKLACHLNALGIAPPAVFRKGPGAVGLWRPGRVWSILTNPLYCGLPVSRDRCMPACPAIVEPSLWEKASLVLGRNRFDSTRRARRKYLLKGLIRCGLCGRSYSGDGSGSPLRRCYYRCTGNSSWRGKGEKCTALSVPADLLERLILGDIVKYIAYAVRSPASPGLHMVEASFRPWEKELAELDRILRDRTGERQRVVRLFSRAIITEEEASSQLASIAAEINQLSGRRESLRRGLQSAPGPVESSDLNALAEQRINHMTFMDARELVKELVDGITVGVREIRGRIVPVASIAYVFDCFPECDPGVETRGKYRLGIPKSPY